VRVNVAELARQAPRPRRSNAVLPPIVTTQAQVRELDRLYARVIKAWVTGIIGYVMPEYRKSFAALTHDSPADLESAINITEGYAVTTGLSFGSEFTEWARGVDAWHTRRLTESIRYATNVDLTTMIGPEDARLTTEAALARNTALIRNVNEDIRNKVSGIVFRGLQTRRPVAEVSRAITEVTLIARARARRIASDQTVKLAAALDQERHQQLGITKFKWRHSGKVHYRPEHLARNGKVFEWNSPVGRNDPPGWQPFCGCKAQAVIEVAEVEPVGGPAEPVAVPAQRFAYEDYKPLPTVSAVKAWMEENVATNVRLSKGVKADLLNEVAQATLEVSERFGLPKVRFMGDPTQTGYRIRWSNPTAAFLPGQDFFMFKNSLTDAAYHKKYADAATRAAPGYTKIAEQVMKDSRFIDAEVKERFAKHGELRWSVSETARAVTYHELGHRLHMQFHRAEIDAAASNAMQRGWHYLIGKYAGTKQVELVAESFALYMQGDESQFFRIFPPLLAIFKRLDKKVTK
jgi:SPP1 gp7 family putative phage head morphogenesis protein